jgi:hypothetical protein
MDAILTTIVSAFVAGAAKSAGDRAIAPAYAALKSIVANSYRHATELMKSIAGLEQKDSPARREMLAEELQAARATEDESLVSAAAAVIDAAEKSPEAQTIGLDWDNVRAAHVKVGRIVARAGAIGFRAARSEIIGLEVVEIDVTGKGK